MKAELKENQTEMAREQKEMQRELKEIQREAMEEARIHAREAQVEVREAQREAQRHVHEERSKMIAKGAKNRKYEVQRIMRDRQKVKIKKTLRIKVPRNAKLEMDVDYCKITTIN